MVLLKLWQKVRCIYKNSSLLTSDYLPTYMGVMGSQKRIHYAFEVLREQGWTQEELDMVYAPIGLDLGAQTPEEIALSIVSEYLAVVRGKKGGSLRKGRVSHES